MLSHGDFFSMLNESSTLLMLRGDTGFAEDTSLAFMYSFTKRIPLLDELESGSLGEAGM